MESNETPEDLVHVMERAEAAPWVDFPRTPAWYPPLTGLWAGGMVAAVGLAEGGSWVGLVLVLVLAVLEGVFIGWYRRYHGAVPSLRRPPREFRRPMGAYGVGVVVVFAALAASWALAGPYVAAVVTGVLVTAGIAAYEVVFARAARRTRERLA